MCESGILCEILETMISLYELQMLIISYRINTHKPDMHEKDEHKPMLYCTSEATLTQRNLGNN